MFDVVVRGSRLMAREEAREGFRRLGEVDRGDHDQNDPGNDGDRSNEAVVLHAEKHTGVR